MSTLTTTDAARIVGVTPMTVRQWVARGHLEPVRHGVKPLLFREDDVVQCHAARRPGRERAVLAEMTRRWESTA